AYVAGEFARRTFQSGALRFSPDGAVLGAWLMVGSMPGAPREFWLIDTRRQSARRVLPSLSDVPRPFPFSWMPDSRRIVFSGVHGLNQSSGLHLWIADTTSDRVRAITASSGSEASPTISPDGKKIVFGLDDLDFDLDTIPVDVDAPRLQPLLATARSERSPAWSPAGNGFAYVTNRSGTDEIWFRSNQGDFERPIATSKDFNDDSPSHIIFGLSFSPDGQRIAYYRQGRQRRSWVSAVAGGAALPLGDERSSNFDSPTWSPDGSSIAFIEHISGRLRLAKLRLGVDSQPVPLLDDVTGLMTHWSPAGQWLTASTANGFFLVSPDGATKRKISGEHWLVHTWSSDGAAIYGIRVDDNLHLLLSRLSLDGKEHVMADLGISPPTNVPLDGFSLSPDGKTLIVSMLKPKGDIWMLEGFDERPPAWWRRWLPTH
ncbi:MAG: hypothetical protein M3P29_05755, partial [Acidobacteriota bacterium]|nr:hypothetical protein [Acidobacteriota bacterium]